MDADHDGRSFNMVMREATVWSSVYGHCWLLLDKPSIEAATRADLAGYPARKAASEARGLVRGLGVANCIEVAGGPFGNAGPDYSRVAIGADESGRAPLPACRPYMSQSTKPSWKPIISTPFSDSFLRFINL